MPRGYHANAFLGSLLRNAFDVRMNIPSPIIFSELWGLVHVQKGDGHHRVAKLAGPVVSVWAPRESVALTVTV